jgi:hypothetical protein
VSEHRSTTSGFRGIFFIEQVLNFEKDPFYDLKPLYSYKFGGRGHILTKFGHRAEILSTFSRCQWKLGRSYTLSQSR